MGQRRRDKKQRKLTQQTTAAIFATSGANQAAQTQQMAMQAEQLRIAQMHAAEAQAAAALAQRNANMQASEIADAALQAARWCKDPLGRHELRYWDGGAWTENVSDGGVTGIDPVEQPALGPGARAIEPESAAPVPEARSVAQELRELADLRDQGVLTDEEFTDQKARLLE